MPMFVHLAVDADIASIRRAGIRIGKRGRGVFSMPVLPNFVISHQWLRELRRRGARRIFAVHFRIGDDEPVSMGHYGREHVDVTAAEAVRGIMDAPEPLGFEVIIPRAIAPRDIHAVRPAPQTVGWRYFPGAHGRKPCGCPACLARGEIKSQRIRTAWNAGL